LNYQHYQQSNKFAQLRDLPASKLVDDFMPNKLKELTLLTHRAGGGSSNTAVLESQA
jgi:hypothetical protein